MITKHDEPITQEQFDQFCESLLNHNDSKESVTAEYQYRNTAIWYMLKIMMHTGLRPSEALALSKNDIHITSNSNSFITVSNSNKSDAGYRQIPISTDLKPILINLLAWPHNDPLLIDFNGEPFDIRIISRHIQNVSKSSGTRFNMYLPRHMYSINLICEGTNPRSIQTMLGLSAESAPSYHAYNPVNKNMKN